MMRRPSPPMSAMSVQIKQVETRRLYQQIADQIVFIASERGRTISGQAISVCADTQMLS